MGVQRAKGGSQAARETQWSEAGAPSEDARATWDNTNGKSAINMALGSCSCIDAIAREVERGERMKEEEEREKEREERAGEQKALGK